MPQHKRRRSSRRESQQHSLLQATILASTGRVYTSVHQRTSCDYAKARQGTPDLLTSFRVGMIPMACSKMRMDSIIFTTNTTQLLQWPVRVIMVDTICPGRALTLRFMVRRQPALGPRKYTSMATTQVYEHIANRCGPGCSDNEPRSISLGESEVQ